MSLVSCDVLTLQSLIIKINKKIQIGIESERKHVRYLKNREKVNLFYQIQVKARRSSLRIHYILFTIKEDCLLLPLLMCNQIIVIDSEANKIVYYIWIFLKKENIIALKQS